MKPSFRNPLLRNFVLAASSVIGFASLATAGTLYWDGNGAGASGNPPTTGVGGNGTWDTSTTASWWDGAAYQLWNSANGQDIADFRGTAGTVTVSGTVNVNKMDFSIATNIFNGGTINFGASGAMDTKTVSGQTINSALSGPLTLQATGNATTLAGTACYILTGNNTGLTSFELALNTVNNHIIIDNAGALGSAASPVKLTTGILNLGNVDGVNRTYNAWTTELAGGTIRGRFGNSTLTGPITLTVSSGMESRAGANARLTLSSAATINLNANTLKLSAQNSFGSGIELNGNITGGGGILNIAASTLTNGANGTGIVTLAGTNSYTGGTNVTTSGATLNLRKLSSLPTTGTTAMSTGTTLSLGVGTGEFTSTDVDYLFNGGTLPVNLIPVTLTGTVHVGIDTTAGDFIYGTSIASVAKNLVKLGANKLTLTGTNAYTGTTTVYEGTLALSGTGTLGTGGALNMNGGKLDLNASSASTGVVTVAAAAPSGDTISNGSLTTSAITAAAYQATNTTGNAIISANLLLNGAAGFTKTGAGGTVSLSGTNTYTGGTTVTTGTLVFLNTNAKPATGTTTPAAAATLGLGVGASSPYFSVADVTALFAGTLTNVAGTNAYTVGIDTTAGDFDYSANLGASTRALTKLGANTLTLSGTNAYDKLITVSAGTLKAGSASAFTSTGAVTVLPGATLDLAGNNASFANITSNTGTITTTGAGSGTDTLTVTALTAVCGNLFTDNGTRKLALTLAGSNISPISNVANTFSGGLIFGDSIRLTPLDGTVGTPGAITSGPFGRGPITMNGASQIWFGASNRTLVNDVIVNGNAGNGGRAGSFRIGTNVGTLTGLVISGNITANAVEATFGSDSGEGTTLLLSGQLTGPNGFRFFQSSNSWNWTTTLNNATANPNDYSGNTTISNTQTTVQLGAANQIPNGAGKGNVLVNFGKLDLNGFSETINGLSGGATAVIDNVTTGTTNTLTLGDGDATPLTAFSGVIKDTTGTLSLTKIGTGIQTLSGANEYSGATLISDGTLLINGVQPLATGAVQVDATLGGTGTLGGAVTVGATGTIAPGASTGELTVPSADLSAGGTLAIEINDASTPKVDKLTVTGALNVTNAKLDFSVTGMPAEPTYVIATGTITGTITGGNVTGLPAGYNLVQTASEIKLVAVAGLDYLTWGGPYGLGAGSEGGDLDNDGLTNFQEYAFGLIPNSGASVNPITQQLDKTTGLFKYTRRSSTLAIGVTYSYESSTTLSGAWTPFTPDSTATNSATPTEEITVDVPDLLLGNAKLFVRVKALK